MPNLTSQMEAVCRRFEELSIRLNQPETAADPAQFRRLMQEYHEAQPVVDAYHALTTGLSISFIAFQKNSICSKA